MESWTRLDNLDYFCEYGCNGDGRIHCEHSSDVVNGELDGIHNAAHWKLGDGAYSHNEPAFLCNYHYEELVLGRTHPTDDEIEPEAAGFEAPSAEEFAANFGEVK